MTGASGRAMRIALLASAAVVYGAFLGARLGNAVQTGTSPRASMAVSLALVLSPFLLHALQTAPGIVARFPPFAVAAVGTLQVLPLFALEPPVLLPALLVLAQGHLLLRVASPRAAPAARAAIGAVLLCPAFVLVEMALAPAVIWAFVFPVAVILSLIAGLFAARVESRADWRRNRPALLARRTGGGEPRRPASGGGVVRLTAYAVGVAVIALALSPFLSLPLLLLPEPVLTSERRPGLDVASLPAPAETTAGDRPARRGQPAYQGTFPEGLDFAGSSTSLAPEVVMRVTPIEETAAAGVRPAYYLRGMVLDTVLEDGVVFGGSTEPFYWTDRRDGVWDGWTRLALPQGSLRERAVLELVHEPIRMRGSDASVLFAPRPLWSVSIPMVQYDPDGLFLMPRAPDETLSYRVRVGERPPVPPAADGGVDPAYLQLPARSSARAAMRAIRRLADEITAGARDDRDRVERVVDYFREGFEYSLESTEFPGLDGVVDFLQRRQGHCTYYAAAATLLLRSLDVPTRIATGFLADDFSQEEGAYVVSTRDGHAWIEVAFDGVGWLAFDPTPASRRAAALAALEPGEEGLGGWLASLALDLQQWLSTGDESFLREFGCALARAPRLLLVLPVAAAALIVWMLRRRPTPTPERGLHGRGHHPEDDLYARLLRVLERLGFERGRSQTPREFSRVVTAGGEARLAPVAPWTERYYRARFGEEPLREDEVAELGAFIDALGRSAEDERLDRRDGARTAPIGR